MDALEITNNVFLHSPINDMYIKTLDTGVIIVKSMKVTHFVFHE